MTVVWTCNGVSGLGCCVSMLVALTHANANEAKKIHIFIYFALRSVRSFVRTCVHCGAPSPSPRHRSLTHWQRSVQLCTHALNAAGGLAGQRSMHLASVPPGQLPPGDGDDGDGLDGDGDDGDGLAGAGDGGLEGAGAGVDGAGADGEGDVL